MASLRSVLPALTLALPIAFGISTGCGDGDGSVSKDDAAKAAANLICDLYFECDCPDFMDPDRFSSPEQCRADQESEVQAAIDEGDAAGLTYDGTCVSDTLNAIDDLGCANGGSLSLDELIDIIEAGQCKLFYGDGEGGAPCESLDQSNGDDCAQGFECVNAVCTAYETYPAPGQECEMQYISLCSGGAICLDVSGDGTNLCEKLPGSGATCLGMGDFCADGLTCDQGSKTCVTAPAAGEACAMANLGTNQCATGAVCDMSGNCVELPGGGEDCVAGQCSAGFTCDAGVCAQEAPIACGELI